jgi:hypothetical protein
VRGGFLPSLPTEEVKLKSLVNKLLQTQIMEAITAVATSAKILSSADLPTAPFVGIFDPDGASPEIVLVTAVTTTVEPNTITMVRGCLGTTAKAQPARTMLYQYGEVHVLATKITDVSTAETLIFPMPKCLVVKAMTAIDGAISVGDDVVTLYKNAVAMTNGVITIAQSGSATGDVDSCSPTAGNEFNGSTDYLKVINGGESTTAAVGQLLIFYVPLD